MRLPNQFLNPLSRSMVSKKPEDIASSCQHRIGFHGVGRRVMNRRTQRKIAAERKTEREPFFVVAESHRRSLAGVVTKNQLTNGNGLVLFEPSNGNNLGHDYFPDLRMRFGRVSVSSARDKGSLRPISAKGVPKSRARRTAA